ncbi:hypothetical protein EVA_13177 [gut metagenome]|uniref:Uncharacterized protein n=1 Tax=gut metagenome TaxID=749906 RepID=J9GAD5_9ZZZZ
MIHFVQLEVIRTNFTPEQNLFCLTFFAPASHKHRHERFQGHPFLSKIPLLESDSWESASRNRHKT